MTKQNDANPEETKEWLDALQSVVDEEGIDRAHFLIDKLNDTAIRMGRYVPVTSVVTPYSNPPIYGACDGLKWTTNSDTNVRYQC